MSVGKVFHPGKVNQLGIKICFSQAGYADGAGNLGSDAELSAEWLSLKLHKEQQTDCQLIMHSRKELGHYYITFNYALICLL